MPKITFMGAGSTVFAKNVLGDCMLSTPLSDSVIALYDIDPQRLEESRRMLNAINNNLEGKGIAADQILILPGAIVPEKERPEYVAPTPKPQPRYGRTYSYVYDSGQRHQPLVL